MNTQNDIFSTQVCDRFFADGLIVEPDTEVLVIIIIIIIGLFWIMF